MKEIIKAVEKRFAKNVVLCLYDDLSGKFVTISTGEILFSFDDFSELTVENVTNKYIDPQSRWIVT